MRQQTLSRRQRTETLTAWGMILPMLLTCLVFYAVPCLLSFGMSALDTSGFGAGTWVGLGNFKTLFLKDKYFWRELWNTLYYAFATAGISIFCALLLARALNSGIRGKEGYRLIMFIPSITMAAVVGVIWRQMLNSEYGLINQLLGSLGINGPKWLTDGRWMMGGAIFAGVWGSAGYNMVILMAGMQSISKSYYEAAQIDGANKRQLFLRVTMPLLTPTLFYVVVTALIGGFKSFDMIFMFASMVSGDRYTMPYRVMTYGIYERGIINLRMGMGSAEAVLLFVLLLLITMIQFRMQKRWVHYD